MVKKFACDYSLCSSPSSGELKVAIKAVENGVFSNYANTKLEAGDTLDVAAPQGRFVFEADATKKRRIAAFTAGSGITPVLSIAKTVLEDEPNSEFVLIYGNKNVAETIFFKQILDLHHKYGERFHIQFLNSQSNEANAINGRIEASTVNLILKDRFKNQSFDAFYLCGPEAMINIVKETLVSNNIAEDKIHFELFKAGTNSNKNAITSTGETEITVIVDDEEETFTMSKKETILSAAIQKDLDAPYSCQGGICSSCIARVKEGTAEMTQNSILTDAEVAEGLIITCQAHPTSEKLIVDYDDV